MRRASVLTALLDAWRRLTTRRPRPTFAQRLDEALAESMPTLRLAALEAAETRWRESNLEDRTRNPQTTRLPGHRK